MGQRRIENKRVELLELSGFAFRRAERSWSNTGALILQIKTTPNTSYSAPGAI